MWISFWGSRDSIASQVMVPAGSKISCKDVGAAACGPSPLCWSEIGRSETSRPKNRTKNQTLRRCVKKPWSIGYPSYFCGEIHGQIPKWSLSWENHLQKMEAFTWENHLQAMGAWLAARQLNKWCIGAPIPFLPVTNHQHVLRSLHPRHGRICWRFLVSTWLPQGFQRDKFGALICEWGSQDDVDRGQDR